MGRTKRKAPVDGSEETPVGKSRQVNYTSDEMDTLLNEVEKRKHILFSSLTNTITNQIKNKEWEIIASRVSAVGPVTRTASQVRGKWGDFASRSKKKNTEYRKEMSVTGGGQKKTPELNNDEQRAINILGKTAVYGMKGAMDSDGDLKTQTQNQSQDTLNEPQEPQALNLIEPLAIEAESTPNSDNSTFTRELVYASDVTSTLTKSESRPVSPAPSTCSNTSSSYLGSPPPVQTSATKMAKPSPKLGLTRIQQSSEPVKSAAEKMVEIETEKLKLQQEQLEESRKQSQALQEIANLLRSQSQLWPPLVQPEHTSSEFDADSLEHTLCYKQL